MPRLPLLLLIWISGWMASPATATGVENRWPPPRSIDIPRAASLGIRVVPGKHFTLVTDVASSRAVDALPAVFDAAVQPWARYFRLPTQQVAGWHVQGYLIQDRAKFTALDMLPEGHADFLNGYALGNELWLAEQPTDYYRRHLLLHEGTHSFMLAQLGAGGPGWYMEGLAELLATHRWQDGKLQLNVMPANREETPMWGRIKIVRDAVASGKPLSLEQVLAIDNRQSLQVDAYAWCWALCRLLDSHPRYSDRFAKLQHVVEREDFTRRFRHLFASQWSDLEFEWQAFVAELDYGYDLQRMSIVHADALPVTSPTSLALPVDRGWQATPWLLKAGRHYQLSATGRFQIANDGQPWPCEPGGVTLRYHAGHPLGMLLGALRRVERGPRERTSADRAPEGEVQHPLELGLQATVVPSVDSQLYLRVNDSPAELSDNEGALTVRIRAANAREAIRDQAAD